MNIMYDIMAILIDKIIIKHGDQSDYGVDLGVDLDDLGASLDIDDEDQDNHQDP